MMDYQEQLKLQAFLDGELPEAEARKVAAWIAQDSEAAGLCQELRHTREAMAKAEMPVKLPESREFYWSRIQREIERSEPRAMAAAPGYSWLAGLRRLLAPTAAVALLAIAGIMAFRPGHAYSLMETSLADPGAFTYRDYATGTTLVWLSYEPENGIAEDEGFGNFD